MKKVLAVIMLLLSATFISAATVGNSTPQHQGDPRHPLCRNLDNLPRVCTHHHPNLDWTFACSFCPVCDENGQLVICKENELPAYGQCCVNVEIDLELLNQLPSFCKVNEGQIHTCGQCPVYNKKDHSCVQYSDPGIIYPSCIIHNGPGGDGGCPAPDRGNSGKTKKNLTPVKPNNDRGTGSVKSPVKKPGTSSKGVVKGSK